MASSRCKQTGCEHVEDTIHSHIAIELERTAHSTMANSLEGCVASLRSSMQLLDSSISILDSGVNDFPRLAKVLQPTRVRPLYSRTACAEPQLTALPSTSS